MQDILNVDIFFKKQTYDTFFPIMSQFKTIDVKMHNLEGFYYFFIYLHGCILDRL